MTILFGYEARDIGGKQFCLSELHGANEVFLRSGQLFLKAYGKLSKAQIARLTFGRFRYDDFKKEWVFIGQVDQRLADFLHSENICVYREVCSLLWHAEREREVPDVSYAAYEKAKGEVSE